MLSVLLPWWHPIKRFSQPKDYNKGPLSCWETATIWSSFLWSYINSEALKTFFFIYIVIARASYNEAHMLGRAAACNAKPTKSPGTTTPLLKIDFGIGIYSISSDTTLRLGTEGWTFSKRQPIMTLRSINELETKNAMLIFQSKPIAWHVDKTCGVIFFPTALNKCCNVALENLRVAWLLGMSDQPTDIIVRY